MAAFQQLLLAVGQNSGTLFLDPSFTASASATSVGFAPGGNLNSAGADLLLTVTNGGGLTVTSVTNDTTSGIVNTLLRTYNWLTNGTASLYSVRVVRNSGAADFLRPGQSQLLNLWIPMTQTVSWLLRDTSPPNNEPTTMNFTLQIARTGDESDILASGIFDFTCTATSIDEGFD
jgi:hypothetical protein